MKLNEGPAFGALIIGVGVGFLVWQRWQSPALAIGAGVGVAVADYIFLIFLKKVFKK